jgi:DNA-binding transcriptional regulator YdaS (Cro superfamily)
MTKIEKQLLAGVTAAKEAAGGGKALADLIGINKASVAGWQRVPAERVLTIEQKTGVPRHQLRPDLYPNS